MTSIDTPRVRYCGPVLDPSGYGHASRTDIMALVAAGVEVTVDPISFEPYAAAYGRADRVLAPLLGRELDWDIQLVRGTPDWWPRMIAERTPAGEKPRRTIGLTAWETSAPHPVFTDFIVRSGVDGLWVPCEFNVSIFGKVLEGTSVDVARVPHALDFEDLDAELPALAPDGVEDDDFVFLSIFQWTERKNPEALFRAYFTEFDPDEKCVLLVKTYGNSTERADQAIIQQRVAKLIERMQLDQSKIPRHGLILSLITHEEIIGLHRRANAYVAPHRGEGFCLPAAQAMACRTPPVVSDWSATTDFCNDSNAYLVRGSMTPVIDMPRVPWYAARSGDVRQDWFDVDIGHLREQMRAAFDPERREILRERGGAARATSEQFALEEVGALMRKLLEA